MSNGTYQCPSCGGIGMDDGPSCNCASNPAMTDPADLWDGEVDDDDDPEPEGEADPSCINCGGQGGWCKGVTKQGQCIWQECDCVEYRGE